MGTLSIIHRLLLHYLIFLLADNRLQIIFFWLHFLDCAGYWWEDLYVLLNQTFNNLERLKVSAIFIYESNIYLIVPLSSLSPNLSLNIFRTWQLHSSCSWSPAEHEWCELWEEQCEARFVKSLVLPFSYRIERSK